VSEQAGAREKEGCVLVAASNRDTARRREDGRDLSRGRRLTETPKEGKIRQLKKGDFNKRAMDRGLQSRLLDGDVLDECFLLQEAREGVVEGGWCCCAAGAALMRSRAHLLSSSCCSGELMATLCWTGLWF
jgi:hypothetical protein